MQYKSIEDNSIASPVFAFFGGGITFLKGGNYKSLSHYRVIRISLHQML